MLTRALRLHGEMDLRLDTFQLPDFADDEILAEVVCDSLCVSSFKAVKQGSSHKRVPKNIAERPPIVGHEFSGRVLKVGRKWQGRFREGDKFAIQPDLKLEGSSDTVGYSFPTVGGDATYVIIPSCVMEMDCLLPYDGDAYYKASLCEPLSCLIRACEAQYHVDQQTQSHLMGISHKGRVALLGGTGPMGLAMLALIVHGDKKPNLIVVNDIDQVRLDRAERLLTREWAGTMGVELHYLNSKGKSPVEELLDLAKGEGFDDVFVFASDSILIETADKILTKDGCLNFFAGPNSTDFTARLNFYNVHYAGTHLVGTSGGNSEDMKMALELIAKGKIDPSIMVSHIGGLESAKKATLNLPKMGGGKKLIYPHLTIPLIAIDHFEEKGKNNPLFAELDEICKGNGGLWSLEAERRLLDQGTPWSCHGTA